MAEEVLNPINISNPAKTYHNNFLDIKFLQYYVMKNLYVGLNQV